MSQRQRSGRWKGRPLLFVAVVEEISKKMGTREVLRKLLCADKIAVAANSEVDIEERLVDWKVFDKLRLRVNLEESEVLWVEQQTRYLDIPGREKTKTAI